MVIVEIWRILLGVGMVLAGSETPCVYEHDGKVMMMKESGQVVALTSTGLDFDPSIAGDTVYFCRRDPQDEFRSAIYRIDFTTRRESLVLSGPVTYKGSKIPNLACPQMDIRRGRLYLLANDSMTTGQLFAVNLRTGALRWVTDAASYVLVQAGPHTGDLLVDQRRRTWDGGTGLYMTEYRWSYYSPTGRRIASAGKDLRVLPPGYCRKWP